MGSLIANGGTTASTVPDGTTLGNDGFWPDIDLPQLRAATRVTGNVTDDRLQASAIDAMLHVNDQLSTYRAQKVADGWEKAEDIGETVAGATALVHRYLRAIYCIVAADVAENYRDWDNTRAGDYRADAESTAADDHRRNAQWAISDILGRSRNVVELI